ncbi:MAG: serine hydrolase domain-containing protein [Vulcanimicrobiaceae bacterium]
MAHLPAMWLAAPLLLLLAITPQQGASVDSVVSFVMQREHIPGLSLAVTRNGHLLYARGYGRADRRSGARPNAYTVYPVGSLLKQIIAAEVLRQTARQAISLRTPVSTWTPEYPWASAVTVRDLLAQQSGLASSDATSKWETAPLRFAPGTSWEYSNANYLVLGQILEKLTAAPWQSSVASLALRLQMISTHTFFDPNALNRATGYHWTTDGYKPMLPRAREFATLSSAGALESNALDLTTWLTALCRGDVLPAKQFDAMVTNQPLRSGVPSNYGFGFFIRTWSGMQVAEHKGNVDGFSADDALVPSSGLAVSALSNADSVDLVPLVHSIVDIFSASQRNERACV